jgi:hypothetical protein
MSAYVRELGLCHANDVSILLVDRMPLLLSLLALLVQKNKC